MSWWWTAVIICVAVLFAIFLVYIYRFEPFNFGLTDIRINIGTGQAKKKEEKLLTILHLSDFHLRKTYKGKRLFDFIQTLKSQKYDLVLITGDMVENISNTDYLIQMLSPLKARYGKFAVFGVHDHYNKAFYEFAKNMFKRKRSYDAINDTRELRRKLKTIGIDVLSNEGRILKMPVGDIGDIEIIGLDEPVVEKLDLDKAFSVIDPLKEGDIVDDSNYRDIGGELFDMDSACIHRLNNIGRLRLALLHTPDSHVLATLHKKDVDIVFSGHTHGGQVRLPLIGAIISGCRIKTRFASGLFYLQKMVLYISRGLGEGKYSQFRCYCPPEASIITIYRTD
ncbi:MAG: metallophosphoesterase [Actinobacteria bacterium]|nr:metallophosphoesterase [Actinomycetota bacterium]